MANGCNVGNCEVPNSQPPASAIPGNIGIARAKCVIWDNDPLLARPNQFYTFPFSKATGEQLQDKNNKAQFETGAVTLKPQFEIHDMWVHTKRLTGSRVIGEGDSAISVPTFELDPVPCEEALADGRLPGSGPNSLYERDGKIPDENDKVDKTTGKSIFPHQVWLHIGNLFKNVVVLHPSEYKENLKREAQEKGITNRIEDPLQKCKGKIDLADLESAAKWDCISIVDGATGKRSFFPEMISKQTPDTTNPVHWSLEKFMPTWQGEDFFITLSKKSKDTDDSVDPGEVKDPPCTNQEQYKYLLYDISFTSPPTSVPNSGDTGVAWKNGISNEAFYIPPNRQGSEPTGTGGDARETAQEAARKEYWWRHKTYLLIEIGVGHPEHNYFIEIVKGRKPRFLHLGEEWDNTKRLEDGILTSSEDWKYIRKCRVLSEYEHVSGDELFRKETFQFSVRNHLGRLVITFSGYEGSPWVITRLDNDDQRFDFVKVLKPCIVPAAKIRIHGGNWSGSINFSPTKYIPSTVIPFHDRQLDTNKAKDEDLYMTFAHFGNSIKHRNDSIKTRFFKDPRFTERIIGYDVDAATVQEYHKNRSVELPLYEIYSNQYKKVGKGWVVDRPSSIPDLTTGLLPDFEKKLGFKDDGDGHRAIIQNIRQPTRAFPFGLTEDNTANYPYKEFVSQWDVGILLQAGSVTMPPLNDELNPDPNGFTSEKRFENFVTPIVPSWNLWLLGGEKPFKDSVDEFDISSLVTSINDSWSAEGYTTINHEMQVRCYIPDSFLPVSTQPGPGQIDDNLHALGQKLLKLHNQSFYLTISYWWDNGIGERDAPGNKINRNERPDDSDLLIQMTGIAYGATLEKSVNKLFMNFTVKDYSSILKNQFIFNSPFFDAVSDSLAVYELAKLAGFDDDDQRKRGIDRRPLGYLQKVLGDSHLAGCEKFTYNGEESLSRPFDLPGSFADVAAPSVRFQNGETYWSAITKIAQLATKVIFFDRWGVLKFENVPAIEAAFLAKEDKTKFKPIFDFVTSPFNVSDGNDDKLKASRFVFDPCKHASHLVYNVINYSRSVEDCVNQIILFSAGNDILLSDGSRVGGFIIEGYTFFDQIWDPNAEGFLGYRKPFYQSNGAFGSIEGVRKGIQHYARMKFPPAQVSFQTYGVPGLKALDIITLDSNLFYITEITHELDPATNRWWMNITAEWLKPFLGDLGILQGKGGTDSGAGNDGDDE